MQQRGWLRRRAGEDGRSSRVMLSAAGRRLRPAMAAAAPARAGQGAAATAVRLRSLLPVSWFGERCPCRRWPRRTRPAASGAGGHRFESCRVYPSLPRLSARLNVPFRQVSRSPAVRPTHTCLPLMSELRGLPSSRVPYLTGGVTCGQFRSGSAVIIGPA
ncbi:MAG: hypothetical protein DRQ55_13710 [Planctomycetota bacterium]|nr:MAG: hypothetical protein DRQ55_13710 [Planctomycetota bacterium]